MKLFLPHFWLLRELFRPFALLSNNSDSAMSYKFSVWLEHMMIRGAN